MRSIHSFIFLKCSAYVMCFEKAKHTFAWNGWCRKLNVSFLKSRTSHAKNTPLCLHKNDCLLMQNYIRPLGNLLHYMAIVFISKHKRKGETVSASKNKNWTITSETTHIYIKWNIQKAHGGCFFAHKIDCMMLVVLLAFHIVMVFFHFSHCHFLSVYVFNVSQSSSTEQARNKRAKKVVYAYENW